MYVLRRVSLILYKSLINNNNTALRSSKGACVFLRFLIFENVCAVVTLLLRVERFSGVLMYGMFFVYLESEEGFTLDLF